MASMGKTTTQPTHHLPPASLILFLKAQPIRQLKKRPKKQLKKQPKTSPIHHKTIQPTPSSQHTPPHNRLSKKITIKNPVCINCYWLNLPSVGGKLTWVWIYINNKPLKTMPVQCLSVPYNCLYTMKTRHNHCNLRRIGKKQSSTHACVILCGSPCPTVE